MKKRILLVDDHGLVRAGIRTLIHQLDDFTVVAEASGVQEAKAQLETVRPDMVITDISMGDGSGLDLARAIRESHPGIGVIILSMLASEEVVAEALRMGVSSYLLKEAAPAELEIALRAVARKEVYLSPGVSTRMVQRMMQPAPAVDPGLAALTARQIQILKMIASRKGTKEIAYELDLSEKTIAAHRAQIMERIGVRDVVGLALFAMKHGLVKPEE
jgi:DNA-binding NarL/FixJ family response regulator